MGVSVAVGLAPGRSATAASTAATKGWPAATDTAGRSVFKGAKPGQKVQARYAGVTGRVRRWFDRSWTPL